MLLFFYHEWLLDFVKFFFFVHWNDHVILSFIVFVQCITLLSICWTICNPDTNLPIPLYKWYIILLTHCQTQFGNNCWGLLCLYSQRISVCSFNFDVFGLGIRLNIDLTEWVGKYTLLFCFLEDDEVFVWFIKYFIELNRCLQRWESSPGIFFVSFWSLILSLLIDTFKFSISSYIFLGI